MILYSNAKINIGLYITEKRSDGYHNLETIFYPVKLYDVIELNSSEELSLDTYGIEIPEQGENLCIKAYNLLKADFPKIKPYKINLLKNIPIGAGLGGGSSNASYVLKALNELNSLSLSDLELSKYAARLGADCPFFIVNKPVFATGIGNDFSDVKIDLSSYYIIIIKPDIHISTAEAYANITPSTPQVDLRNAIQLPIQEWKYNIVNDFEIGIFDKYPQIAAIKHALYEKGAIYASMSGSGSSVFGIFNKELNIDDLSNYGKIYYPVSI